MNTMYYKLVAQTLDEAIAAIAKKEFEHLGHDLTQGEVRHRVRDALDSLGRLQKGSEPNYDAWDALFYLSWYQPGQINLALKVVRRFFRGQPINVIDVGCGALAVQFALAITHAEPERQIDDYVPQVSGIDPSEHMRQIGESLWLEFWSMAESKPGLTRLAEVCDEMTDVCDHYLSTKSYYQSGDAHIGWICPSPDSWLAALHAVYDSNVDILKTDLDYIHSRSDPALTVVTTHSSKRELLRLVSPKMTGIAARELEGYPLRDQFRSTTEWRKGLNSIVKHSYLDRKVPLCPRNPEIGILERN